MKSVVVVSLSVATSLFILFMTLMVVGAIMLVHFADTTPPANPDVFEPKTGMLGELKRQKNEINYGPVNLQAAKEEKDGLFANIRARRQARQQASQCQPQQVQTVYSVPQSVCATPQIIIPSEVTQIATPAIEYPQAKPQQPQAEPPFCPDGSCDQQKPIERKTTPRTEIKTGDFVCSNCRKPVIGDDWHTDWNEDGSPTTFLCKTCNAKLDEDTKAKIYVAYNARQAKLKGGTLHQEIAK
jgi:hypothetical protein